jgi:hypothetical protein
MAPTYRVGRPFHTTITNFLPNELWSESSKQADESGKMVSLFSSVVLILVIWAIVVFLVPNKHG